MVETTEWHVRSNGLNFIIMDQDCSVVAECRREADANLIVNLHEQNTALKNKITDMKSAYWELCRVGCKNPPVIVEINEAGKRCDAVHS